MHHRLEYSLPTYSSAQRVPSYLLRQTAGFISESNSQHHREIPMCGEDLARRSRKEISRGDLARRSRKKSTHPAVLVTGDEPFRRIQHEVFRYPGVYGVSVIGCILSKSRETISWFSRVPSNFGKSPPLELSKERDHHQRKTAFIRYDDNRAYALPPEWSE